jgi:hypothetical protein
VLQVVANERDGFVGIPLRRAFQAADQAALAVDQQGGRQPDDTEYLA